MTVVLKELTYEPGYFDVSSGKWECGILEFKVKTPLGELHWDEVVPGPRHGDDSASLVVTLNGVELELDELSELDFESPGKPGRWADAFAESIEGEIPDAIGAWLESNKEDLP